MTFEDLNLNNALRNALSDLEMVIPTPIQRESFSLIMSGKDVVGIAQTGTGKTFAFLLPVLRNLKYSEQKHPRVLILAPTRELVIQIEGEILKLTKYMNVRVKSIYGGVNMNTQKIELQAGMDILVSTPRRLFDLCMIRAIKLKQIKQLIIDEVDEMLNLGFRPQLESLLDLVPQRRQNILFSATLSREVELLVKDYFNYPTKIEIAPHGTPLDQIDQYAYDVPNFYTKVNLLTRLLNDDPSMQKVLVFTQSKKMSDLLFESLDESLREVTGVIHSNKSQNRRIECVNRFHEGSFRLLIATDLIARGIDISEVSHVVNFDLHEEAVNYIHRIGRTGRADKNGIAISFINENEKPLQDTIEQLMGKTLISCELPQDLEISQKLLLEEKPVLGGDKPYMKEVTIKDSQGAFHEKSEKNKKVNLGGSYRRKLAEKYKKPQRRAPKKR